MPQTTILFFCLSIFATSAFSQQTPAAKLPAEIETVIKGIETKIVLLDFRITTKGAFGEVIFKFKNPLYFDAQEVPISPTHISIDSFKLKLQNGSKNSNTEFIRPIIEQKEMRIYLKIPL